MVWASQDSSDDAAVGLDSVRAKPLKKRCSSRAGLSRYYSSKSQSFTSLELVQCTAFGASALALAKRPASFDLRRGSTRSGLGHTTSGLARRTAEETFMSTTNEEDDSGADRCPCNDTIFADPADAFISPEGSPSASPLQLYDSCCLSDAAGVSNQQFQLTSEYLGQLAVLLPFQQALCQVAFSKSSCGSSSFGSGRDGNTLSSSSCNSGPAASRVWQPSSNQLIDASTFGGSCGGDCLSAAEVCGGDCRPWQCAQRPDAATRTLQQSCSSRHRGCRSAGGYFPDSCCSSCAGGAAAMQHSLVPEPSEAATAGSGCCCAPPVAAAAVAVSGISTGTAHPLPGVGLARHRLRHSGAGPVPASSLWGSTEDLIASLTLGDRQQQHGHGHAGPQRGAPLHRPTLPCGSAAAGGQGAPEPMHQQPQPVYPQSQPMLCGAAAEQRPAAAPEQSLVCAAAAQPCYQQQQQAHHQHHQQSHHCTVDFQAELRAAQAVQGAGAAAFLRASGHGYVLDGGSSGGGQQQQPWVFGSAPAPTSMGMFGNGRHRAAGGLHVPSLE